MKSLAKQLLFKFELAGYLTKEEVSEIVDDKTRYAYIKLLRGHGVEITDVRDSITNALMGYKLENIPKIGLSKNGSLVSNFNNKKKIITYGTYKGPNIFQKIIFRFFTAL